MCIRDRADAAHRLQELRPLLNDYRALVIDEAHKLPDAARQMYGQSLSAEMCIRDRFSCPDYWNNSGSCYWRRCRLYAV